MCSVGGAWYTGNAFPEEYRNLYYFADWGQAVVKDASRLIKMISRCFRQLSVNNAGFGRVHHTTPD